MADLKKRIYDILFEDDEAEIELAEKISDSNDKKEYIVDTKEDTSIKAKDILYRKSDIFVDLNEKIKPVDDYVSNTNDSYVFSSQISPIFGLIKEEKKVNNDVVVDKKQISKPADSHLDIITSPIYGYGTKESDDLDSYMDSVTSVQEPLEIYQEDNLDILNEDEEISLFKLFGDK